MSHNSVPSAWKPLLEGSMAARALGALEAITTALPQRCSDPSLSNGEACAALLFWYLSLAQPGRGWAARANTHLDQAVSSLSVGVVGPALYSGFTGIAWAVDHLQGGLSAPGEEDPNEEVDAALEAHLSRSPWKSEYDLTSGLVGYGVYGLDRVGRPSGRHLLEKVIERLDGAKREVEGGVSWFTAPDLLPEWLRKVNPEGYYNLGLAHGMPAVIALLGQACAADVAAPRAMALLEGAVAWLIGQQYPPGSPCAFGTTVPSGRKPEFELSRIAWCYGDLGVSVALLWAARSVGRADWEGEALTVARRAACRNLAESGVHDAGLCHGAAGNAHLFNRLWQATGEDLFREAALTWFEQTLAFPEPWVEPVGLLLGGVGVGLALMGGLYPILPEWDRVLLVSVPPRVGGSEPSSQSAST